MDGENIEAQGEDERTEFDLILAGCRNVKAAKALLEDHGGDIDVLKAAEPWIFQDAPAKRTGKTGLANAGAVTDAGGQLKRFREVAGLAEDE